LGRSSAGYYQDLCNGRSKEAGTGHPGEREPYRRPRLHDSDFAYILQHTDRRVIFVIPYEGKCSLIGTTDVNFHCDPAQVEISPEETQYLCAAVSEYFT
jgi:hypothetical protein